MGSALPYRLDLDDDVIETITHLRRRHAAHALRGEGGAPAAGARVPARRSRARRVPQPLARAVRRRPVQAAPLQGRLERRARRGRRVLPAAVLRRARDAVRLPAGGRHARPAPRRRRRDPGRSGATRSRATSCSAATRTGRCCRRRSCSCRPRSSTCARRPFRASTCSSAPRRTRSSRSPAAPLPAARGRPARAGSARRAEDASSRARACAC